jgi:hypothetical protein
MIWYYSACKKLPPDDASGRSFLDPPSPRPISRLYPLDNNRL